VNECKPLPPPRLAIFCISAASFFAAFLQGLTLVNFSAQPERFL